jgi:hypothetical protein
MHMTVPLSQILLHEDARRGDEKPPEVARTVAGGPSEASDHRSVVASIFYDRGSGRGGISRRLVFDPRLHPESISSVTDVRWSLASLGPPATVRVASGDGVAGVASVRTVAHGFTRGSATSSAIVSAS